MADIEWTCVKEDYIEEFSGDTVVVLKLSCDLSLKEYNQTLNQMLKIAPTKRKSCKGKKVYLHLQYYLEEKWNYIFRKLSESPKVLANIDYLDFQHSEFSFSMLYDLYTLYCRAKSMGELPNIFLVHCPATFEAKSTIEKFELNDARGIEFLKKVCMTGNSHCEDTANRTLKVVLNWSQCFYKLFNISKKVLYAKIINKRDHSLPINSYLLLQTFL